MLDLHLWRLLQAPHRYPTEAASLLSELADLPIAQRVPYLGLLPFAHPDADVRRAAVSALAGCTGRPALQKMVLALNDTDEQVRLTAVEALRHSLLLGDWPRWVHALFHPDDGVRQAAIAEDQPFPPPFLYKLYLLPDPVCRPLVERQMATARIDGDGLPLLFDFLSKGVVSAATARWLARGLSWNDWLGYLGDLVPRTSEMLDTLAQAMRPDWPEDLFSHYRPDRLDDLILLFWDEDPPEVEESPHARFFDLLWEAALSESAAFQQWIVFTMLGMAVQRRSWPSRAAQLCAVLYPPFLACPWIAAEVRSGALAGFYRAGTRCPKAATDTIRGLVQSELCRGPGGLDLWAVGALLHALESQPYQRLMEWIPVAQIAAAFQGDLERAVLLLSIPDSSSLGRRKLLREVRLQQGIERFRLLALLARAMPSDSLDLLDTLDGVAACGVLAEVLVLESAHLKDGARPLSENKVRRLAELLADKIAAGQVERFFRTWLDRPDPQQSAVAPTILARLIHDHDSRLIHPALASLPPELLKRFIEVLPSCAGFPYDDEIRLAERLAARPEEELRSWGLARLRDHQAILQARAAEQEPAPPEDPVLRLGIVEQLQTRLDPVEPNVGTCQALLASHDPVEQVVVQFARFSSPDVDFVNRLDCEMVKHWQGEMRLPFLGHAWLFRWDRHLAALGEWLDPETPNPVPFEQPGVAGALSWALTLTSPLLVRRVAAAIAAVLEHWRWHDRERLHAAWEQPLADVLVQGLRSPAADLAAQIILHWRTNAGNLPQAALLIPLRQRLVDLMPSLPEEIRQLFSSWIDIRGLAAAPDEPVANGDRAVPENLGLDELAELTWSEDQSVAARAAEALLERGEPG